jgi:hypothetical protein
MTPLTDRRLKLAVVPVRIASRRRKCRRPNPGGVRGAALPTADGPSFTPLVTARLDAPIATVEVGILGVFASGVFAGGVGVHELLASRRRPLPKRFQRGRWDHVAAAPGKQTAADSCGFLRADERIRTADPFITSAFAGFRQGSV